MQRITANLRNAWRDNRDIKGGWRIFLIYMVLLIFFDGLRSALHIANDNTVFFVIRAFCFIGALTFSGWLIGRLTGWHLARRNGIVISRGLWVLWGVIIGLVGRAVSYWFLWKFRLVHWQTADYSLVCASFFNSIAAGICEELAFRRGLLLALQPWSRRKCGRGWGRVVAWGGTSAVFALPHILALLPSKPDLPTCVVLFLVTFAASLLFIGARLAGKSLLLPIAMHFMWNFGLAVGGPALADTAAIPSWLSSLVQEFVVLAVAGFSLWLIAMLRAHSPKVPVMNKRISG